MDTLLYLLAIAVVGLIRLLPLTTVARLGRFFGGLAYAIDGRHRKVAVANLTRCFGREKSAAEIRALARENFRRIGENYASAARSVFMTAEEIWPHFDFVGAEKILPFVSDGASQSRVFAIGHFGNFELYARFGQFVPHFKCATTYRGLRQPGLNRLLKNMRERSGCQFFERRTEAAALKAAMTETGLLLGLLADQHAGNRGVRAPFLDHDCSTSTAPAVFALRYHCPLHTAICYRTSLAHWRIEVGPEIPTRVQGHPRPVEDITREVNAALETAVRRDPANWFWVHNRWKSGKANAKAKARERS